MRLLVLALFATLALSAAACGDDDEEPAVAMSPLAIYAGEWNADKAATQGVLEREGNCLYVGESPRLLVAFASSGTSWDAATETVVIPGGSLRVGEAVMLAGSQAAAETPVQWLRPPNATCDQSNVWLSGPA